MRSQVCIHHLMWTVCACRFVPLLVALLSGASSGLAGAAADVLAEIVLKRMEASAKLR